MNEGTSIALQLRDPEVELPYDRDLVNRAADYIEELEARYAVEVSNHGNCLDAHEWAMQQIGRLEAELARFTETHDAELFGYDDLRQAAGEISVWLREETP